MPKVISIERLVTQRLPLWASGPPVDPAWYARHLSCRIIAGSEGAARLEISREGAIIRARADAASCDQRFEIAHEIGHLLQLVMDSSRGVSLPSRTCETSLPSRSTRNAIRTLERWCNTAARVMLMPGHLLEVAPSGLLSLAGILSVAQTFDVPIPVSFRRLLDLNRDGPFTLQVLLRYGPNIYSTEDPKWRVAHAAVPYREQWKSFPRENSGVEERLGIVLPLPNAAVSGGEFEFRWGGSRWIFRIEIAEEARTWLLGTMRPYDATYMLFDG
jgi:hypothetical protein